MKYFRFQIVVATLVLTAGISACGSDSENGSKNNCYNAAGQKVECPAYNNADAAAQDGTDSSPKGAVCESSVGKPTFNVSPEHKVTGEVPNTVVQSDGFLWIVQSGSNTVGRYNLSDGSYQKDFIDVGSGKNPFDIAVAPEARRVFITNFLANSVTVADFDSGDVITEITSDKFASPQDIALTEGRIYVTNVNLREGGQFGSGKVTVINRANFEVFGNIQTSGKNPQFITTIERQNETELLVSNTGTKSFDENRNVADVGKAYLDIWTQTDTPLEPERKTLEFEDKEESPIGGPGEPVLTEDKQTAYLPSSSAPVMFKVDLKNEEIKRGVNDPIQLYETDKNSLNNARMGPDGIIYITAFNEDALYLLDSTCDEILAGPIDLGKVQDNEGPQAFNIVESDSGLELYYTLNVSGALGKATIEY